MTHFFLKVGQGDHVPRVGDKVFHLIPRKIRYELMGGGFLLTDLVIFLLKVNNAETSWHNCKVGSEEPDLSLVKESVFVSKIVVSWGETHRDRVG